VRVLPKMRPWIKKTNNGCNCSQNAVPLYLFSCNSLKATGEEQKKLIKQSFNVKFQPQPIAELFGLVSRPIGFSQNGGFDGQPANL